MRKPSDSELSHPSPSGRPARSRTLPVRVAESVLGLPGLIAVVLAVVAFWVSTNFELPRTRLTVPSGDLAAFSLGGIQVNEPDHERWFDGLIGDGFNTVQVTDYARQGDWDSYNLFWDDDREGVLGEIRGAKARGLRVVLVLRVALDHAFPRNRFLWHGMIMPMQEDDLTEWFARYRRWATEWARLAEAERVDAIMIGSELNQLASTRPIEVSPVLEEYFLDDEKQSERRERLMAFEDVLEPRHLGVAYGEGYDDLNGYLSERIEVERGWARAVSFLDDSDPIARVNERRRRLDREWRNVADVVRERYHGPIGFAANFDQYHDLGFWDALDVMGVNAYFSLREGEPSETRSPRALEEALTDGWRRVLGEIRQARRELGVPEMPVLFTELGYTRRAKSTIRPWAGAGFFILETEAAEGRELVIWEDEPEGLQERALAVRALHAAHAEDDPFLVGILYWKLSTLASHREIEPFVVLIDQPDEQDPMLPELRRFVSDSRVLPGALAAR